MEALGTMFAPESIPLGVKVTRNVLYNTLRFILLAPLPFVLVPFFLKKLGPGGYGTWAVFLAVNGMTSLADFGLLASMSRHVAQFYVGKDFRSLGQLISTGFLLYFLIACAASSGLWFAARILLAALFRGSPISASELTILWRVLILLVFGNILTLFFSSVVLGLQRMDLTSGMSGLSLLLSAGLSVVLLHRGMGLRGLVYAYTVATWVVAAGYACLLKRLLPEVRLRLASCRWEIAREILAFSVKAYVTQVAVAIHNQIEKFYLARFVGVVPVAWYDVSSDLALKLRGIPSLVLAPIMPAASELNARNDDGRLMKLYFRAHKYLAFVGVPIVVYMVLVSQRFVQLWVGPSLSIIAVPFCILLITNFFNLTTGPGFLVLMGKGTLRPGLYSAVLGIVLNLTVSLVLIRAYDFQGAIIGTSISLCVASGYFLWRFQREVGKSPASLLSFAYLKPLASSFFVGALLWASARSVETSWMTLLAGATIFGVTYLFILLGWHFFDAFDLSIIERITRLPWFIRRIIPNAELGGSLLSDPQSPRTTSE